MPTSWTSPSTSGELAQPRSDRTPVGGPALSGSRHESALRPSRGHAGPVIDLDEWADRIRRSTEQLVEGVEERYGYAPGINHIVSGSGRSGSMLRSELEIDGEISPSVVEFFNVFEEVSLPDMWNGYFIGPATRLRDTHAEKYPRWLALDGRQLEILVVGSDGGGALYVVGVDEDSPVFRIEEAAIESGVLCPATERQVQRLAANFSAFLDLMADCLESLAAGRARPTF